MTPSGGTRFWRSAGLWTSVALLLLSAWFGLKEGTDGLRDAETGLQRVAAGFQCLYGAAAIGCLWALYARAAWYRAPFAVWVFAVAATAGLAPIAWGESAVSEGLISGLAAAVVAGLGAWGGHVYLRGTRRGQ